MVCFSVFMHRRPIMCGNSAFGVKKLYKNASIKPCPLLFDNN